MRGATEGKKPKADDEPISIHAPHAGSDSERQRNAGLRFDFNPRSPCGERLSQAFFEDVCNDFNPRSPCGERLK